MRLIPQRSRAGRHQQQNSTIDNRPMHVSNCHFVTPSLPTDTAALACVKASISDIDCCFSQEYGH